MLPLAKSQLEKYKEGWKRSFQDSFSQDENGNPLPWMTYGFIEFITRKLNKNQQIFEFGLGASTFFFAKKVKKVTVIESNPIWFKIMKMRLAEENIDNVEVILMEDALENEAYEKYAQNYSIKNDIKFDLILVDSLKRFQCSKESITALKEDGILILDDSQRKGYKKIFDFFENNGFHKQDFYGIAPGQLKIKNSTIFKKND